jgi:sugar phosphate isomerase/epimerase
VALHAAPARFFKTAPPYDEDELLRLVQKAASLGFKAVQIGPLHDFVHIEGEFLRGILDSLGMARSVHVGGLYDARKFAVAEEEIDRARRQIRYGIDLSREIGSKLVSIHPPFFPAMSERDGRLLPKARARFLQMLEDGVSLASRNHVRIVLESFCYRPFIFEGLQDFLQFVSEFPSEKLGVLLDAGHVYQIGIDLFEAINLFKHRLSDVHVHDARLHGDFRRATHLPLGKGTLNFPDFIEHLGECGYEGWLTLERNS